MSAFNIITTIFNRKDPEVKQFQVTKFPYFYINPHSKVEHATGVMDFEFDFTPVFNWNTNLIFIWISATYQTGKNNVNNYLILKQTSSVTIYDKIMRRSEEGRVVLKKDQKFEYPIMDFYKTLPYKFNNVEIKI